MGGRGNSPESEKDKSEGTGATISQDCESGSEGCSCYGNGTCDGSLSCFSDLCVDATTGLGGAGSIDGTSGSGSQSALGGGVNGGDDFECVETPDGRTGSCDWTTRVESFSKEGNAGTDSINGVAVDTDRRHILVVGEVSFPLPDLRVGGGKSDRRNAYLRKYDEKGELLWTRQFGTVNTDTATGVALNARGEVFVVGTRNYFEVINDAQGYDSYLEKFDVDGVPIFTIEYRTPTNEAASALAIDKDGNIAVVGKMGRAPALNEDFRLWGEDFTSYVQLHSPTGEVLWTRRFASTTFNEALDVETDNDGNIIVVGVSSGFLNEEIERAPLLGYVRKYDIDGNVLWSKQLFSSDSATSYLGEAADIRNLRVVRDASGNLLFASSAATGSGPDEDDAELPHHCEVHKWDASGMELWSKPIGDGFSCGDISRTAQSDFVVVGRNYKQSLSDRMFVQKVTSEGDFGWQAGLEGIKGNCVAVLGVDSVIAAGNTEDPVDFDGNGILHRFYY